MNHTGSNFSKQVKQGLNNLGGPGGTQYGAFGPNKNSMYPNALGNQQKQMAGPQKNPQVFTTKGGLASNQSR